MAEVKTQQNIPSGWQSVFVDDICHVMKGQGLSKKDVDPSGKNKCLLYGELFTTYDEVIEDVKSRTNSTTGTPSVSGDILIPGSTTTVARDLAVASALNEDGVLLGGDINILRKKDNSYDSKFLAYYLTHYKKDEIGKLGQGTTIVHLYGSNIKDLEVVIPKNINEQKKIAEILCTVDEDIAETQGVIEATEKLRRGLMQQLFTRGIGHTKFKETKIGQIPEEWDVVSIRNSSIKLIDGDRGINYPKQGDFSPQGFCLFLSAKNVSKNGFVFNEASFISQEKDRVLRKGKLERGDIILTSRGTVGNVAYYDEKIPFDNVRINSGMLIVRHGEQFDPVFLYRYFSSPQMEAKYSSMGSGSAQPQLPVGSLEQVEIPLIPIQEQKEIANIISAVNEKILVNKKLKEKLNLLKNGLMQDLLSGTVRTNI